MSQYTVLCNKHEFYKSRQKQVINKSLNKNILQSTMWLKGTLLDKNITINFMEALCCKPFKGIISSEK